VDVFKQRNFVADFIRLNLNFCSQKMTNSLFEPPFGGVRGNVRTSSIARWKARGRLLIRNYYTFFANSYGSDVYKQILVEVSIIPWGVGHFKCKFQVEEDIAYQPVLVSEY